MTTDLDRIKRLENAVVALANAMMRLHGGTNEGAFYTDYAWRKAVHDAVAEVVAPDVISEAP